MKRTLPYLITLVLLAGCSAEHGPAPAVTAAATTATGVAFSTPPVTFDDTGLVAQGAEPPGLVARPAASAELLAYDARTQPQRRGAYTMHPVTLDESHAFAAARPGGGLLIAAPDGELIPLDYERHVEHPDGDWTWIGRDADGRDAVVTFGQEAVYGSVPRSEGPGLRLTTQGGRTWMVETDAASEALAARRVHGLRDSDMKMPPRAAGTIAQAPEAEAADSPFMDLAEQAAITASASNANTTVIDVVVGFSAGLATELGSDANARTRINYLMEVANQSLTNGRIAPRLRLVHSMRVNYADNTSNESALEQLTGYDGDAQVPITVPSALRPLRTARETYGGDLVVLLRAFRTPQNEGCGIAWVIGGDRSPYTNASSDYAYSVVSDGQDFDEEDNSNYYCLDTSLAHEIGHNLGQVHSTHDADMPGAHVYSYGYREASSTGFFTVMAYSQPDGNQTGILYFANPDATYNGRPAGRANAADNARSMRQTMPVAAGFRETKVPQLGNYKRTDVNGDGRSDLLWWKNGSFVHWWMNGPAVPQGRSFTVPSGWRAIGAGDFNGDGRADVVWQAANGDVHLWNNTNGNAYAAPQLIGNRAGWRLVGTRDVDGNGTSDLQWFRAGTFVHWRLNTGNGNIGRSFSVPSGWTAIGTGDLNGDGRADVIWRGANGAIHYWRNSTGNGYAPAESIGTRLGWELRGIGDINGDRREDLLWWRSGTLVHWQMEGSTVWRGRSFPMPTGQQPVGLGDFNGDGRSDIVVRTSNGDIYLMLNTNGNNYTAPQFVRNRSGWNSVPM